eukprot:CAMPEP_0201548528 /NCGR_PEP_ID=MMETSP0173_2-20130828/5081_1 /ASSEMBLY_ACC=CAM_ASM_000268 /TAXON_ID=218659 /ORGANISM="Vexillifera sp., Strain DIVA3 564/2" /LENGTH=84 /DNA_ID=CAMNT_0047957949 /DNA_START=13 /DNA_END=267 /DNA_ORIENTATION=-
MANAAEARLRNEYQKILQEERFRLEVQLNMLKLTEKCWDACMKDPAVTRLSQKEEACLKNCVYRYFDTQVFVRESMFGDINQHG